MSGVLLFQPKKGEVGKEGIAAYRPVAAGAVKGAVASVLDVHFSPYRVLIDEDGKPCRPSRLGDDGVTDDSAHIYLKPDKNRTGGPSPTQILNFDAVSGRIWDEDHAHALATEVGQQCRHLWKPVGSNRLTHRATSSPPTTPMRAGGAG